MNGKKWIMALVITLLLGGGAGAYYAFRTDPMVAQAMDLQQQMQQEGLSREDRGRLWGEMRQTMEQLTPEQRDKVFQNMGRDRNGWMAREQKRMDDFFAMNRKDQIKQLDKQIDDMVKEQKEREKRRKERDRQRQSNGQAGGQGGPGGGGPGGGGPGGGRGGPPGGGRGAGEDRSQQRRVSLDNSSAAQRAQRTAYREMFTQRMQQRGIPFTGGRGGPGGGRGF